MQATPTGRSSVVSDPVTFTLPELSVLTQILDRIKDGGDTDWHQYKVDPAFSPMLAKIQGINGTQR